MTFIRRVSSPPIAKVHRSTRATTPGVLLKAASTRLRRARRGAAVKWPDGRSVGVGREDQRADVERNSSRSGENVQERPSARVFGARASSAARSVDLSNATSKGATSYRFLPFAFTPRGSTGDNTSETRCRQLALN